MFGNTKPVIVIGGGIAGITAAVEIAEVGYHVILVEKEAYLGGRVLGMYKYFPKMCPPSCGFEINIRRIKQNPRITVYTLATVNKISGEAGNFKADISIKPRYVTDKYPIDDSVAEQLTSMRSNEFNYGMDETKALYLPHDMAYPHVYVLDKEALNETDMQFLKNTTPQGAIDIEMIEKTRKNH